MTKKTNAILLLHRLHIWYLCIIDTPITYCCSNIGRVLQKISIGNNRMLLVLTLFLRDELKYSHSCLRLQSGGSLNVITAADPNHFVVVGHRHEPWTAPGIDLRVHGLEHFSLGERREPALAGLEC